MKQGWTYKKLGEVCEKAKNIRWEDYDDQRIFSYIDLTSVDRNSLSIKNPQSISKLNAPSRAKQIIKEGDVLFATTRPTLRRVCIIPTIFDSQICSTGFCVIRPKQDINSKWFYYALQDENFYQYIEPLQTGASYPAVTDSIVKNYNLLIPPLSEQERIVSRLDSSFAHIDELKANAKKQVNEARALFQKALAKAMEPKEGWEHKKLEELCEIKSFLIDPTEIQYRNCIHVGGANIVSETGELVELKTAAEEELTSAKFTFDDNDVLYNKIRPYLIKVTRPNFSGLCSADMYPLTPKAGMTKDYLYYILVSRDFTDYAIQNSARAGMPKLNRQALFAYSSMIPPISEQQRIVARLDSLSENVRKYEEIQQKVVTECDALKQALLRKVFE